MFERERERERGCMWRNERIVGWGSVRGRERVYVGRENGVCG